MSGKLRLGPILDDKPVRMTVELSTETHRQLVAYADALARQAGQSVEAATIVGPMLAKFMAADRAFRRRTLD
jgi:hypothetical protein